MALAAVAPSSSGHDEWLSLPTFDLELTLLGSDCRWQATYRGERGRAGSTPDVVVRDDVRVPHGARVRLHLRSVDYVYTVSLPALGLKEMAVPDLDFSLEFTASQLGAFELRGDPLCGLPVLAWVGSLSVEPPADFVRFLRARRRA